MCEYTDFLFGDGSRVNMKRPPGLDNDDVNDEDNGPKRNSLGCVEIGGGNEDHSDLNGMGESDCLIRSTREDRLCMKDVLDENGYIAMSIPGVVAQTADPEAEKQVKGVISLCLLRLSRTSTRQMKPILTSP